MTHFYHVENISLKSKCPIAFLQISLTLFLTNCIFDNFLIASSTVFVFAHICHAKSSPQSIVACLTGCPEIWTVTFRFRCSRCASDERVSLITYVVTFFSVQVSKAFFSAFKLLKMRLIRYPDFDSITGFLKVHEYKFRIKINTSLSTKLLSL